MRTITGVGSEKPSSSAKETKQPRPTRESFFVQRIHCGSRMDRFYLLSLLVVTCFLGSLVAALDDPFILVTKKSDAKRFKDGEKIFVSYRIDNVGGGYGLTSQSCFLIPEILMIQRGNSPLFSVLPMIYF